MTTKQQKNQNPAKENAESQPESVEIIRQVSAEPSLAIIEKSQMEILVSLAKSNPRSISVFLNKAAAIITQDEDTALSCIYKRPVGRDEDSSAQKIVEGQSIRLAEIVHSTYGNIFVSDIDAEVSERYVKTIGFAIDLETLSVVRRVITDSTVKRNGEPFSERMRFVAAKAAAAKARRDAIFSIVPKSLCNQLYGLARDTAFGKGNTMTMAKRRDNILKWADKLGIDKDRLFAVIKVKGIADVGIDQIETLYGLKTAIHDGDITIDEAFPPLSINEKKAAAQGNIAGGMGSKDTQTNFDPAATPKGRGNKKKAKEQAENLQQNQTSEKKTPIQNKHDFYCTCKKGAEGFDKPKKGPSGEPMCPFCLGIQTVIATNTRE